MYSIPVWWCCPCRGPLGTNLRLSPLCTCLMRFQNFVNDGLSESGRSPPSCSAIVVWGLVSLFFPPFFYICVGIYISPTAPFPMPLCARSSPAPGPTRRCKPARTVEYLTAPMQIHIYTDTYGCNTAALRCRLASYSQLFVILSALPLIFPFLFLSMGCVTVLLQARARVVSGDSPIVAGVAVLS